MLKEKYNQYKKKAKNFYSKINEKQLEVKKNETEKKEVIPEKIHQEDVFQKKKKPYCKE